MPGNEHPPVDTSGRTKLDIIYYGQPLDEYFSLRVATRTYNPHAKVKPQCTYYRYDCQEEIMFNLGT